MVLSSVEKLITKEELAYRLRVSVPTINRWMKADKVKKFKIGKRVLFDPNDYLNETNDVNQTPNT